MTTTDDENAKIRNSFFSNAVKYLKIPEFEDIDFSAECISHPALKVIVKFHNHSSVSAISNTFNPQSFNFSKFIVVDVFFRKLTNKVIERQYRILTFL